MFLMFTSQLNFIQRILPLTLSYSRTLCKSQRRLNKGFGPDRWRIDRICDGSDAASPYKTDVTQELTDLKVYDGVHWGEAAHYIGASHANEKCRKQLLKNQLVNGALEDEIKERGIESLNAGWNMFRELAQVSFFAAAIGEDMDMVSRPAQMKRRWIFQRD